MLTLYALRMPLGEGFDPFGAHSTSWVEHGMPSATTAAAMLGGGAARRAFWTATCRCARSPPCWARVVLGLARGETATAMHSTPRPRRAARACGVRAERPRAVGGSPT